MHPGDTAGDSPRLRIDNHLLDFSAEGGALVVRPPEGERTFLLGGPSMQEMLREEGTEREEKDYRYLCGQR